MDQAIYCRAQHIRWQDDVFQRGLVLRLGEFHTAMVFLGTIGKRYCNNFMQIKHHTFMCQEVKTKKK